MKSIRFILLSYFQQHFMGTLGVIIAIILFIIANVLTLESPDAEIGETQLHWDIFLYALILMVFSMASHLKRLIRSNASALLPNYRRNQLIAAGLILILFLIWPIFFTGIYGFPVLTTLAMFLFSTAVVLWLTFSLGENIIILLIIIWPLRLCYELLGLQTKFKIFTTRSNFIQNISGQLFPVFLIILSGVALYLFANYFLKVSVLKFALEEADESDPYAKDHDRSGKLTTKIVNRNILKISRMTDEQKLSHLNLARLFKFSLFSPGYVVNIQSFAFVFVLVYFASILYFNYGDIQYVAADLMPILLFIYHIGATILTTDFLQHRNRMPALYLWANLTSRKAFTNSSALSYIMVAWKQYFILSLMLLILPVIFPGVSLVELFKLFTMGANIFVILLSLSLMFSQAVLSPDCRGWTLTNILFAIITLILNLNLWHEFNWLFILGLVIFSILLFWISVHKWSETEMDFAGPEFPG